MHALSSSTHGQPGLRTGGSSFSLTSVLLNAVAVGIIIIPWVVLLSRLVPYPDDTAVTFSSRSNSGTLNTSGSDDDTYAARDAGPCDCSGRATSGPPHQFGLDLYPAGFTSIERIIDESGSDKKDHKYGLMYAEYLDPLRARQKTINMMEIGLKQGHSLQLWMSAINHGHIYGVDYNPRAAGGSSRKLPERVHIYLGDQANVTFLNELSKEIQKEVHQLDFIVDDGGHTMEQQITSFTVLFPLVRPGGLYFIEDMQTSYWEKKCHEPWDGHAFCYGGGPPGKKNTTVDLIKSLLDVINGDFHEDHPDHNKLGSGVYHVNPVDHLVGSVQCWRNMCVIRRKYAGSHF